MDAKMEINTIDGKVTMLIRNGALECHIPSNWRWNTFMRFRDQYREQIRAFSPKMPAALITKAYQVLSRNEAGYTYNPWTGDVPAKGYAVGLTHNPIGERLEGSPGHLHKFCRKHGTKLRANGMYIGIWHNDDDNTTYLDLVKVVTDREEAIELGRMRGQISIFDISKDKEIKL